MICDTLVRCASQQITSGYYLCTILLLTNMLQCSCQLTLEIVCLLCTEQTAMLNSVDKAHADTTFCFTGEWCQPCAFHASKAEPSISSSCRPALLCCCFFCPAHLSGSDLARTWAECQQRRCSSGCSAGCKRPLCRTGKSGSQRVTACVSHDSLSTLTLQSTGVCA